MLSYKIPNSDVQLKINIVYGPSSIPKLSNGNIYHLNYGVLMDFIEKIYRIGSDLFLTKFPEVKNDIEDNDFYKIKKNINNLKELKKVLPDNNLEHFISRKKWFFKNLANDELFKTEIKQEKKTMTLLMDNPTYIYNNDELTNNDLLIFKQLNDYENLCIKMPSIVSSTSYDFLILISYICKDVYICRSLNQAKLKDSWYIFGLDINKVNLNKLILDLPTITKENKILSTILTYDKNTKIREIFSKFTIDICFIVSDTLSYYTKKIGENVL